MQIENRQLIFHTQTSRHFYSSRIFCYLQVPPFFHGLCINKNKSDIVITQQKTTTSHKIDKTEMTCLYNTRIYTMWTQAQISTQSGSWRYLSTHYQGQLWISRLFNSFNTNKGIMRLYEHTRVPTSVRCVSKHSQ